MSWFIFQVSFISVLSFLQSYDSFRLVSSIPKLSHGKKVIYSGIEDIEAVIMNKANAPLKQLQIRFNCDDVDSDDISELLFEVGTLSVSVEVESEKEIINDQSKWADLIKTKSWNTALLRANFPNSYNSEGLIEILTVAFPEVEFEMVVVDVEDKDWVSEVQKNWAPQVIGGLIVRFPWHLKDSAIEGSESSSNRKELVLEGGAAFGTGDHPTTRLCCLWLEQQLAIREGQSVLDYGCGSAILGLAGISPFYIIPLSYTPVYSLPPTYGLIFVTYNSHMLFLFETT
jgi:hypothetical protein